MDTAGRRLLHYVLKIGDRPAAMNFFRNVLGMSVLRHEEFEAGCKATCNGPYDGRWSKTMIGYGAESRHFVLELTYNYGVAAYRRGNDLQAVTICSRRVAQSVRDSGAVSDRQIDGALSVRSPDGYKFLVYDSSQDEEDDVVTACVLSCSSLDRSLAFWVDFLGLRRLSDEKSADGARARLVFGADDEHNHSTVIELVQLASGVEMERAAAFGRTAISCPTAQLTAAQSAADAAGINVLTRLVTLETPGKAAVSVVIVADPDHHEVCLVGEEGFSQLSQLDPEAGQLLDEAMKLDKSVEWFAKKGGKSGV